MPAPRLCPRAIVAETGPTIRDAEFECRVWTPDMSEQIVISMGKVEIRAELDDSPTSRAIVDALPIQGQGNRWGGEVYFDIDVEAELEQGAREVLEAGELGYWPPGRAFCIFFGPTPASHGDEIRAASPVNVVGRLQGDLDGLWDVPDRAAVSIRRALESR